jgi:hypothetical protein
MVDTVYLANIFCLLENGDASFEQIESGVLERFGIKSKAQIQALLDKFSVGFMRENVK